jgi:hypothetical protein
MIKKAQGHIPLSDQELPVLVAGGKRHKPPHYLDSIPQTGAITGSLSVPFLQDYPSHSPAGINRISPGARDDMTMAVHDRLACSSTDIKPDIVSGRFFSSLDQLPAFGGERHYRAAFIKG